VSARQIFLIRHAEKPPEDNSIAGVALDGTQDEQELIVRGWQRSGALVRLFAPLPQPPPREPPAVDEVSRPDVIFASAVGPHSKSLRPQHTVSALAEALTKSLVLTHAKGEEEALVADAIAQDGTVLIAWEHEAIPAIANLILGDATTVPQKWPRDRFDIVWIFTRMSADGWTFRQVPQVLLPGDQLDLI
jgi:hypothetical protein